MSLQQQMSLFQEGGLEQDGNTIDPESGNDVPIGSSQEEVRDDIPAQLSEGEFVFPADVVRYLGLEFLMKLRQRAKAGLARMEEMGQMGNSEEATVPDDVPFTIDDLDMEDEPQEFQEGGSVEGITQGGFRRVPERPRVGIPRIPEDPIMPVQPLPNEEATFMNAPAEQPPTDETTDETTFESLLGSSPETYDELRKYVGPNGEISYIAFKDGKPLPAYVSKEQDLLKKGYVYEDPATVGEEELADPTNVGVETAQVRDREGDATDPMNMRKRENEIQKSYVDTIQSVMQQEGLSAEDAVQFIKNGNYKVMGKTVPGFLFPDIKLANQNLTNPSPYTIIDPDNFDKSGNQISFTNFSLEDAAKIATGGFEDPSETYGSGAVNADESQVAPVVETAVEEASSQDDGAAEETDKPGPPSLSDRPIEKIPFSTEAKFLGGKDSPAASAWKTKEIQDPSDIARVNAEIRRAKREAIVKKSQELADARQAEKELNQEQARAENKLGPDPSAIEEKQKQTPYAGGGRYGGFKQGGIASKKPKKKKTVMKRGGLASKK